MENISSCWLERTVDYFGGPTAFNLCWSGIMLVLVLLVLALHHRHRLNKGTRSLLKIIEDNLVQCAVIILILGMLLYGYAYWSETRGNLLILVPRIMVSSLRMFVSSSSLLDVKSSIRDSMVFMSIFTIVHFSAVLISAMVILKVLGYRIESYIRMKLRKVTERTLVFWGVNENSLMLAESISEKSGTSVIFVDIPSSDNDDDNLLHGVFNDNNISRDHICRLENAGSFLVRAKCGFGELNVKRNEKEGRDIYSLMGIRSIRKFVRNAADVSFYFLSDCENENLDNLMAIVKFFGADKVDDLPLSRIFCHARRNSLNNIIGRISDKICFMDSSSLSVLQLQKSVKYQPAAFVDIDNDTAVVKSAFNALVVGFGETGRDAFKFLYEFSAFPDADGNPAPRTINVVDARLSGMKPVFLQTAPALEGRRDIEWWEDMSIHSQSFWDRFRTILNSLNYTVITLNDDKTASDFAARLYEAAYRYRADMKNFRIFVKIREQESADKLIQVTNYYSKKSNREDRGENVIVPFGTSKSLFNARVFDKEIIDVEAKKFSSQYYELYRSISEKLDAASAPAPVGTAKDYKKYSDYQQDVSNVRHVYTKRLLAGVYDDKGKINDERQEYLRHISERHGDTYPNALPASPAAYTFMDNMGRCEHLRWNAKMELLGFVQRPYNPSTEYPERDYDRKNHECIVSCQELDSKAKFRATKIYDWAVVELTFRYDN